MRASELSSIAYVGVTVSGAIALLIASTSLLLASEDCLTGPNARTAQGEHWYYYSDPVSKRKCWFRREQPVNAPEAVPPKRAAEESESPSLLSRLVSAMRPSAEVEQPSAKNANTPSAKSPDARAADERQIRPRKSIKTRSIARRQQPSAESAERRAPDQSKGVETRKTDALFREFLAWRERIATTRTRMDAIDRDALFRHFLLWNETSVREDH